MKFGILVPDRESGIMAEEIGARMDVEMIWTIVDKLTLDAQLERLLKDEQVDGIIARSPFGNIIEQKVDIPVSTIHISRQDLISAVQDATSGKRVAFLYPEADTAKFDYDPEELLNLPNHPIQVLKIAENCDEYDFSDDAYWAEEGAYEKFRACQAIASATPNLLKLAQEYGMEPVVIRPDPFEIQCAVSNLRSVVRNRMKEKNYIRLLETVLDTTTSGFMILKDGKVELVNRILGKMAEVPFESMKGMKESRLKKLSPFLEKVMNVRRKEIITYKEIPYSVFRRPLNPKTGQEETGPVELISIIDVPQLSRTETAIRKSIDSQGFIAKWRFEDMIAEDPATKALVHTAKQYANASSNVLILGESGTGKDVLAQCIHNASPYARGPFVALNCASVPENLLESELFGYEEGSFTGAKKGGKPGIFEISYGGTLFLDEIGEMPMALQAKLLRAIQDKAILRLGGRKLIPVRNRLIFATNRDPMEMVREKAFRHDLLYRINVLQLTVPPLRDRPGDVSPMIRFFLSKYQGSEKHIEEGAVEYLTRLCSGYNWPGNVRELQNILERLLVMQANGSPGEDRDEMVRRSLGLIAENRPQGGYYSEIPEDCLVIRRGTMKEMEDHILKDSYSRCGGNMRKMAEDLDLGYNTIRRRFHNEK